jgi:hypothetical protein
LRFHPGRRHHDRPEEPGFDQVEPQDKILKKTQDPDAISGRFRGFPRPFFRTVAGFCLTLSFAAAQTTIMPLDQVKAGQRGKGRTVFEENKIEEFDAEILGVLKNTSPKRNIIIARLKGKNLENTGVIAGMSGSPVYIDGKLIGAVALGFPYSKEAIAGITPIGEMMGLSAEKTAPGKSLASGIPFRASMTLDEILDLGKDVVPARESFIAQGQALAPLRVPLAFSGFSPRVMDKAGPFFSRMGFFPVKSGSGAQSLANPSAQDFILREGDPVTLQLVSGDLDLSATGTVTYVEGNKILAFGHPLYNLGAVNYAMARAKIITVVPTLDNSFKLAETGNTIGTFTQDRASGALGEIGKMPSLVPLNIRIYDGADNLREFKLHIVNDPLLTAILVNMSLLTLLENEVRAEEDLTLEFQSDIYLDSGVSVQNIHLEDLASGNFNAPVQDLAGLLTAVVFFLTNNEFKDVGIHRIDLAVKATEQAKSANLERVWLDKYEAAPGETITVKVYYRTFRGDVYVEEIPFTAPNLPAGSEFQLIIGDAASMQRVEAGMYRTGGVVPRNLNQLVRLLNNLRKNNRIYVKIIASKPGLFLRGEEMPNLPPAMKSLFASPRAAATMPIELSSSTLGEYQIPLHYQFKGSASIPIKIRK